MQYVLLGNRRFHPHSLATTQRGLPMIEKEVSEYIDRSGLGRRQFLWYGGVAESVLSPAGWGRSPRLGPSRE